MRHAPPSRFLWVGLILAAAGRVWGQRLELGGPGAPGPGAVWIHELAGRLEQAGPMPASRAPAESAAGALRGLAGRLLLSADAAGPAGSGRFVAAMTLLRAADEVAAFPAGAVSEEAALRVAQGAGEEPAGDLDAYLRGVLAPLAPALGAPAGAPMGVVGWVIDGGAGGDDPAAPDPWGALELSARAADAVAAMRWAIGEARDSPAGAAGAAAWTRLLDDAGRMAGATPARQAEGARFALARLAEAGAMALERLTPMDPAPAEIQTLAKAWRMLEQVGRVQSDRARLGAESALWALLMDATPVEEKARRIDGCARALGLCSGPALTDRAVVRQLRPAWRTLEREHAAASGRVAGLLGGLLENPASGADPAVVAEVTALAAARDRLAHLRSLSLWLADVPESAGEPRPAQARRAIADRLLPLAQRIAGAATRDAALVDLERLAQDVERFASLPGEGGLVAVVLDRAPEDLAAAWGAVAGDRLSEVLARIDAARAAWEAGLAAEPLAADPARMRALHEAMGVMAVGVEVERMRAGPGGLGELNAWPGWEWSALSAGALAGRVAPLARAAADAALDGGAAAAVRAVADLRQRAPEAELIARLNLRARELGLGRSTAGAELALGPMPGPWCWLSAHRADLAEVCRYLEETARESGQRSDAAAAFARSRAARVLESLGE